MANLTGTRSNFPNSIDEIMELYSLPASLKPSAQRYQELIIKQNPTPTEVAEIADLTTVLQQYIIDVEKWNKFGDILINMQNFFKNETEGYIEQKQSEFQSSLDQSITALTNLRNSFQTETEAFVEQKHNELQAKIDKFQYKGVYDALTQYYKNNVVEFFDGSTTQLFLALQDSKGITPTNTTYWRKLTLQGPQGERGSDGIGLHFRGAWNADIAYSLHDGVQYGGALFASLVDNNIGNIPNLSEDTTYWARVINTTVIVRRLVGVRTIVSTTNTVNFIIGDINSYNPTTDSIEVFANSVRLTKGLDYTISTGNTSIVKLNGNWTATSATPIYFEFVVTKNMIENNAVFADGNYIVNATVGLNKLKPEVIEKMVYVGSTAPDPNQYKIWINTN